MRRPRDTTIESRERQLARYRAMSPEARLRLAAQMSDEIKSLSEAGRSARAVRVPIPRRLVGR